ncbi:UDP-N-acetylmuramate dehydrogenase [Psychromonas sp. 14N.309.X.WAT.B.A12]|uniref:UDP-N-acetylmuramate dehydrogenase n=1 Tax=unclassified Psychromonas TaxID=2614957 RepID=UPI0025B11C5C|nr:UDP-N-acetylmuramate dehydrogenase [Psychromonas sp. 14N.309.X.WAT.B.A12]MDN2664091.1 UDP-N-acetylmuramate dehydrogenase [Psychromonas sp. 14N.309.X.WAT.B.A12]
MIEKNSSLKAFNSFSIDAQAHLLFHFTALSQLSELLELIKKTREESRPILVLGGGSNTLFCDDFDGLVIKVELMGIKHTETSEHHLLAVAAGEDWHQLVEQTVEQGINGLENLALIPGVVGAAPVQNIGAYGVELKDFCEQVDYIDLVDGSIHSLTNEQCKFAYRDSIFKGELKDRVLITSVSLKLPKQWQAHCQYGLLQGLNETEESVSALQIFDSVCRIRTEKLPDPKVLGNAGSFFKNPIVSEYLSDQLLSHHSDMPHYPQQDGNVKLAAGWLIDQCGLKGHKIGGAAVHLQQALVLINEDGRATADDVIQLAWFVREQVLQKFAVLLEHEVRFIGAQGETNLLQVTGNV